MKFSSLLALVCLTTGTSCRPIVERDRKVVAGVLSQCQSGMDRLDTTVTAFNGDATPLTSASKKLVSTINSGKKTIQRSSDLGYFDALALLKSVKDLQAHGQRLSNDLKAKRPAIQTAKQCGTARHQIKGISTASQELIDVIVGKIPTLAQDIAAGQAAGITKVLDEAAANFAPGSCTDLLEK